MNAFVRRNSRTKPIIDQREREVGVWGDARWPSMTVHRTGMDRRHEDIAKSERSSDGFRDSVRWCDYVVASGDWHQGLPLDGRVSWLIEVKSMGLSTTHGLILKQQDLKRARRLSDDLAQRRWVEAGEPQDRSPSDFGGSFFFAVTTQREEEKAVCLVSLEWAEKRLRRLDPLWTGGHGCAHLIPARALMSLRWFNLDPKRPAERVEAPTSLVRAADAPTPSVELRTGAHADLVSRAQVLGGDQLRTALARASRQQRVATPAPFTDLLAREQLIALWVAGAPVP